MLFWCFHLSRCFCRRIVLLMCGEITYSSLGERVCEYLAHSTTEPGFCLTKTAETPVLKRVKDIPAHCSPDRPCLEGMFDNASTQNSLKFERSNNPLENGNRAL